MTARLHAVETIDEPPPSLDYEWQDRQRIMRRDWAGVHTSGDRSAPLPFWTQVRRLWR